MVSRIIMTCGGFALAFLGCIIAFHGSKNLGTVIASVGVIMLFSSLPSTTREE